MPAAPPADRARPADRPDRGASAVEYGLLIALIAGGLVLALVQLGGTLREKIECVSRSINSTGTACSGSPGPTQAPDGPAGDPGPSGGSGGSGPVAPVEQDPATGTAVTSSATSGTPTATDTPSPTPTDSP